MFNEVAMYVLSAIILALGAVSLFTQKVSTIDKETGAETTVELPFFGKLKTNIPALAFVFIGAGLAAFTYGKASALTDQWVINGQFTAPESGAIDWGKGSLLLAPSMLKSAISPDGTFEIQGSIRRGLEFEDVVDQISYGNACEGIYTIRIMPKQEYDNHKAGKPSNLENAGSRMRVYRPLPVISIQKVQQ